MNKVNDKLKRCPDCGLSKPTSDFWRNRAMPDGKYAYCKGCGSRRNREATEKRRLANPNVPRRRARAAEVPAGMKQCLDCQQIFFLNEFVRNRSTRDGRTPYCRPCQYKRVDESRQRLHGGSRHYHLKRRYGIGADEVLSMVQEQAGRCPICFTELTVAKMHVDHDHVTGEVRGAVCFSCNGGLRSVQGQRGRSTARGRLPRVEAPAVEGSRAGIRSHHLPGRDPAC